LRPPFYLHVNYGGAEEKDADPHNLAEENLGRIYGGIVTRRLRAMGIRDKPTHRFHLGGMALPNG
jgi:hypothetical protein